LSLPGFCGGGGRFFFFGFRFCFKSAKKESIFQGKMVAHVFLHTVQTVKCADNADNDWTDVIPKSNSNMKKCTDREVAVFQV